MLKGIHGSGFWNWKRSHLGLMDLPELLIFPAGYGMIALLCDYIWCALQLWQLFFPPWIGLLLTVIWINYFIESRALFELSCDFYRYLCWQHEHLQWQEMWLKFNFEGVCFLSAHNFWVIVNLSSSICGGEEGWNKVHEADSSFISLNIWLMAVILWKCCGGHTSSIWQGMGFEKRISCHPVLGPAEFADYLYFAVASAMRFGCAITLVVGVSFDYDFSACTEDDTLVGVWSEDAIQFIRLFEPHPLA